MAIKTRPTTNADVSAPIKMLNCCARGVAPTIWPTLSACAVLPPFDAATHTTPAIVRAVSLISLLIVATPSPSRASSIKQVSRRVATVIPEMGFEEEPISPVNRDETVTNRNPNRTIMTAPAMPV